MQLLTPIILIGIAIAGFFGYVSPHWSTVQGLQKQQEAYQQILIKAQEAQQIKQTLEAKYNTFTQTDITNLTKALPDSVDNIRLLLDLNQLALSYGVNLSGVKINSDATAQAATTQTPPGGSGTGTTPAYSSVGINFTVKMPYDTFLKFMADIQRNLRLTDISSISFNSVDNGIYDFNVALKTYWLK